MKITETKKMEKELVALFKTSEYDKNPEKRLEAKEIIEKIFLYFKIIDVFTNANHLRNVKQLYFSRNNIVDKGVTIILHYVDISERPLLEYRKRYCKLIKFILNI